MQHLDSEAMEKEGRGCAEEKEDKIDDECKQGHTEDRGMKLNTILKL